MKNIALSFLPALLFAGGSIAHAQATYQWDTNGPTAGLGSATNNVAWNTTDARWDLVGTGVDDGTDATVAYTFATDDTAIFGLANAAPVGTDRQAYFDNGSLAIVVIPIPEPAAALLGSLGLLALLRRRRVE